MGGRGNQKHDPGQKPPGRVVGQRQPREVWDSHGGARQAEIVLRGPRIDSDGLTGAAP